MVYRYMDPYNEGVSNTKMLVNGKRILSFGILIRLLYLWLWQEDCFFACFCNLTVQEPGLYPQAHTASQILT